MGGSGAAPSAAGGEKGQDSPDQYPWTGLGNRTTVLKGMGDRAFQTMPINHWHVSEMCSGGWYFKLESIKYL
jgi:hypothetical protein